MHLPGNVWTLYGGEIDSEESKKVRATALHGMKQLKYNDLREKVMINMHEKKISVEPMSL